jgi:hypothetical protein
MCKLIISILIIFTTTAAFSAGPVFLAAKNGGEQLKALLLTASPQFELASGEFKVENVTCSSPIDFTALVCRMKNLKTNGVLTESTVVGNNATELNKIINNLKNMTFKNYSLFETRVSSITCEINGDCRVLIEAKGGGV